MKSNLKNDVIVVRVIGGLGNQMFQYACARAQSLRSGSEILIDISGFKKYKLHNFGLNKFRIDLPVVPQHLELSSTFRNVLLRLGVSIERQMKLHGFQYIREAQDLSFEHRIQNQIGNLYLDGYWQSENYFKDVANVIRSDFNLLLPSELTNLHLLFDSQLPLVSLHIRRGDYAHNPLTNAVHGTLDLDYYFKAINFLASRIGENFRILIFSDDIDWARHHLSFKQPISFITNSTATPHEDLHMMKSCDHHIIANSSFSWWGAWLNPSKSKIVVAPKKWFASPLLSTVDICPSDWERI